MEGATAGVRRLENMINKNTEGKFGTVAYDGIRRYENTAEPVLRRGRRGGMVQNEDCLQRCRYYKKRQKLVCNY